MATYYQKLALVLQKSGNGLFHACALHRLYHLCRDQKKNITESEVQTLASKVFCATLAIPLSSGRYQNDHIIDVDDSGLEKQKKLATLLSYNTLPSRSSLIRDVLKHNILQYVYPELVDLYNLLEVEFHPTELANKVEACLQFLSTKEEFAQYVSVLQDVTIVRFLKQISQVYQTISQGTQCYDNRHIQEFVFPVTVTEGDEDGNRTNPSSASDRGRRMVPATASGSTINAHLNALEEFVTEEEKRISQEEKRISQEEKRISQVGKTVKDLREMLNEYNTVNENLQKNNDAMKEKAFNLQATINRLEERLEEKNTVNEKLEEENHAMKEKASSLQDRIDYLERKLDKESTFNFTLQERVVKITGDMLNKHEDILKLQAEVNRLEKENARHKDEALRSEHLIIQVTEQNKKIEDLKLKNRQLKESHTKLMHDEVNRARKVVANFAANFDATFPAVNSASFEEEQISVSFQDQDVPPVHTETVDIPVQTDRVDLPVQTETVDLPVEAPEVNHPSDQGETSGGGDRLRGNQTSTKRRAQDEDPQESDGTSRSQDKRTRAE